MKKDLHTMGEIRFLNVHVRTLPELDKESVDETWGSDERWTSTSGVSDGRHGTRTVRGKGSPGVDDGFSPKRTRERNIQFFVSPIFLRFFIRCS